MIKIIKFNASWNVRLVKAFEKRFEKLKVIYANTGIRFVDIDVSDNTPESEELASKYMIGGIPCTIIELDGKETYRFEGCATYEHMFTVIDNLVTGKDPEEEE